MNKDRFVVARWPDSQHFMEDRGKIHLIDDDIGYERFGDSAYFIEVDYYQSVTGNKPSENDTVYLAISFPESKLFLKEQEGEVYKTNDLAGKNRYGQSACFVEESLYKEVRQTFEKGLRGGEINSLKR